MYRTLLAFLVALGTATAALAQPTADEIRFVDSALMSGDLERAESLLAGYVNTNPASQHARFGLGVAQFLRSGEELMQSLYEHGFNPQIGPLRMMGPIPAVPLPVNGKPQPLTHDQLRDMVATWINGVARAEQTLSTITDNDVKLRLKVGLLRMDLNSDGRTDESEQLWQLFNRVQQRFRADTENAETFEIAFDRGDVSWLRGYCHLCMALGEFLLAHDTSDLFDRAGHIMFSRPVSDFDYLALRNPLDDRWADEWFFADIIAFIHLINFEVTEPARMNTVLGHLESAVSMSRDMWTHYAAELDNDREWVPNPMQDGIFPNARIDQDMQGTWLLFLDEAEAVLKGERLVRFWRTADGRGATTGRGINLRKVFTEPRRFDLVLWVQGTAALPYLESGKLTTPGTWARMERATGQHVFRFSFWLN